MANMKFSIRDLLWLTVLAGMGVAWWMDRRALSRERAALEMERALVVEERASLKGTLRKQDAEFLMIVREFNDNHPRAIKRQPPAKARLFWELPLYYPPDPNSL
jgi:hypothetical protein